MVRISNATLATIFLCTLIGRAAHLKAAYEYGDKRATKKDAAVKTREL